MGLLWNIAYYSCHPNQLRSIIQWKVWHNPPHERDISKDSETLKKCFHFLQLTSRSFSTVILELHPEMLIPVTVFYLVLRGLDTIEDDTSVPFDVKEPLLRDFKNIIEKDGWTWNGNRPEEKDRQLLVEFDNVIAEYKPLKPTYRAIIKDITNKMGNGMADFVYKAETDGISVQTVEEYDLYCYYVAGLVGEGVTRLFVEAQFGNPGLLSRPNLHKSMGLFLQKINIIRDIREDHDDRRHFWPKEIWSKHVDKFEDLFDPQYKEAALNCNSEMVLNALNHVEECLFYLAGIREQSVFNFCAIPQAMAIATLELCFRNYSMFQRNIKITKGDACRLMIESTQNLRVLCDTFRKYTRKIHQKNTPKDPNFVEISIVCGNIERFIETLFPSQKAEDAKSKLAGHSTEEEEKKKQRELESWEDLKMMLTIMGAIVFLITIVLFFVAWLLGARFDLALAEIRKGNFRPPNKVAHSEL
ncbi:putative squalene synthase [Talaromyces atroroseus]|uniref:squalene synthase n=1 Tax=Talaromyces atroroseus TaxID=1441469 RepID=A0A1Q5QAX9_TALAT|nr:putative squalene synthase [Talaromyces atroroseus]OKL63103.1 putative squalene synthase [Talaromyces atroroseus]